MDLIKTIEEQQKKENALLYKVGDTVVVHFEIIEGKVKRIQKYEGVVICIKGAGVRKTFTVRKTSYGVGVERVFPVYSPRVIKVEILKTGKVRQSKIYYLRDKVGKGSRIIDAVTDPWVASLSDQKQTLVLPHHVLQTKLLTLQKHQSMQTQRLQTQWLLKLLQKQKRSKLKLS